MCGSLLRLRRGGADFESDGLIFEEIERELLNPLVWANPQRAKQLQKDYACLKDRLQPVQDLSSRLADLNELLALAEPGDAPFLGALESELTALEAAEDALNKSSYSKDEDCAAILCIQSGSGGVEAQDFVRILCRMYCRWAQRHAFSIREELRTEGEYSGVRKIQLRIEGPFAYGLLRAEEGIHRLERVSPFGAGALQTSFASVTVSPVQEETQAPALREEDVELQTFRSSGKGGQNVNKRNSAVRLTHQPTGIVVTCQEERSQHANRMKAMKRLQEELNKIEHTRQKESKQALHEARPAMRFSQHIRTYALDSQRVTDKRTGLKLSNPEVVLDGDIDALLDVRPAKAREVHLV